MRFKKASKVQKVFVTAVAAASLGLSACTVDVVDPQAHTNSREVQLAAEEQPIADSSLLLAGGVEHPVVERVAEELPLPGGEGDIPAHEIAGDVSAHEVAGIAAAPVELAAEEIPAEAPEEVPVDAPAEAPEDAPEVLPEEAPVEPAEPAEELPAEAPMLGDVDIHALVVDHGAVAVAGLGEANLLDFTVPAWSTIKVPVAIAALRQHPERTRDVSLAIRQSSNEAAARLWNSLANSADDTEAIIIEGGSSAIVQGREDVKPFIPFGLSEWGVLEQADFASGLRCVADSAEVVEHMSNITNGGDYGLGTIPGAIFKGGWGPDKQTGAYGVRQFGLIPSGDGYVAVALAATSPDGSYVGGQRILTQMAQNLQAVVDQLPRSAC